MISVAIMAHKKRAEWVPGLQEQLGDCEVVWDRHNDRHETGLRSIQAYDPEASHHLIVQDDAVLCRDFRAGVERLIDLTGEHPVGLYMGNVGPQAATLRAMIDTLTPRFVEGQGPHWGVAILLPTAHVPALADWYERQNIPNYDRRISRWYDQEKIRCWYSAPSLVQHRADNPSLVQGRNGGRQAAWFIGEDESALEVEWESEPWRPPSPQNLVEFHGPHGRVVKITPGTDRFRRYSEHPAWVQTGGD